MKLPHHHHSPKMGTSLSISFLFLVLAFTTYPNIKISNAFAASEANQHQDQIQPASQELLPADHLQQVKLHHPGCGAICRLLVDEEPPPKQGKKPKPPRRAPWWKRRPRIPRVPKWGQKKSPPRPGPWGPPVWPPLTPVRALRTRLPAQQLVY